MNVRKHQLVFSKSVGTVVDANAKSYAKELLFARSFSLFEDGLKPSARALLLAARESCGKENKVVKSNFVLGVALSKYHPHGQLVSTLNYMMNQRNSLFVTNGSVYSAQNGSYTAERYIDLKLSPLGKLFLAELNRAPKAWNYDNTEEIPAYIPARFPYGLFSDSVDISFGIQTSSFPLNAYEVLTAMITMVEEPDITSLKLAEIIKGPDLAARMKVFMSKKSLISLLENGYSGRIHQQCDTEITKNEINVYQAPFRSSPAKLRAAAVQMINSTGSKDTDMGDSKKLIGVKDVVLTGNSVFKLSFVLNKGADASSVKEQIMKKFKLYNVSKTVYTYTKHNSKKLYIIGIIDTLKMYIERNRKFIYQKYQDELENLVALNAIYQILKVLTYDEIYNEFKDWLRLKNKVALTHNLVMTKLPEAKEEDVRAVFASHLNKLSDVEGIDKFIKEFEARREALLAKMTEDSIDKETIAYLEGVRELVTQDRLTEVIYSKTQKRVIEIDRTGEAHKTAYVTNLNRIAVTDQEVYAPEEGIKLTFNVSYDTPITIMTDKSFYKVMPDDFGAHFTSLTPIVDGEILAIYPVVPGKDIVMMTSKGRIKRIPPAYQQMKHQKAKGVMLDKTERMEHFFITNESQDTYFYLLTNMGRAAIFNTRNYMSKKKDSDYQKICTLREGEKVISVAEVIDYDRILYSQGTKLFARIVDAQQLSIEASSDRPVHVMNLDDAMREEVKLLSSTEYFVANCDTVAKSEIIVDEVNAYFAENDELCMRGIFKQGNDAEMTLEEKTELQEKSVALLDMHIPVNVTDVMPDFLEAETIVTLKVLPTN